MSRRNIMLTVFLLLIGAVLNFAFTGHDFIAYALYLIAALNVFYRLAGKTFRRIVNILLALCLVYFCVVEVPIIKNAGGDTDTEAKYIIVLGAAVHGDVPSLSLLERMEAACDYLQSHPDTVAILSGGKGDGENLSEADAMFDWLCAQGIDESRLLIEDKSTSTKENLINSFEIIRSRGDEPDGSTAIVTSEYHIYRAKLIGRSLGVELAGVSAHTSYFTVRLNYFIREAFGVTYQWVFG